MLNEEVLKIVLNDKTFSQREAEKIVGSRGRLFDLVGKGAIRAEKNRPIVKMVDGSVTPMM